MPVAPVRRNGWAGRHRGDAGPAQVDPADTPMERPGQPEEVAPAFVFFASNADSSYITGEVLTLLGGETTTA